MTSSKTKTALVITSIAASDHPVLNQYAKETAREGMDLIIIGDKPSPETFQLPGSRFYSLADQLVLNLGYAVVAPIRHYARKNIGYLLALADGAEIILETDDDNIPKASFWNERHRTQKASVVSGTGWCNVYKYFSDANIWPRGFPLDLITAPVPPLSAFPHEEVHCPIQQGLADENPDVDAVYRLALPLPQSFTEGHVALGAGAWTPFNSQNTTWWREAAPLMYLPSFCSFRMTDIWRSFVAQRIAWENGWHVLFHTATVKQERNEHNLMRDFEDEIPGYLNNRKIAATLEALTLMSGVEHLGNNLYRCYEALVANGFIPETELPLVRAWLADLETIAATTQN